LLALLGNKQSNNFQKI